MTVQSIQESAQKNDSVNMHAILIGNNSSDYLLSVGPIKEVSHDCSKPIQMVKEYPVIRTFVTSDNNNRSEIAHKRTCDVRCTQ